MRFPRPQRRVEDERILPLINVVFLLLIFFMVAGRLTVQDPFVVTPPKSASDGPSESIGLLILVGTDGRLALNGEELKLPALTRALAGMAQDPADLKVRVKADGRAEATLLIEILEHLRDAGVSQVTLLTLPRSSEAGGI